MTAFARAGTTIAGAAAAGGLVWVASQIDGDSTGRYWAVLGMLAGAGLLLALGTRLGKAGPESAATLVLALPPILLAVAWIAAAGQPGSGWLPSHVGEWSRDLGIASVVRELVGFVEALAVGFGVVLGAIWPAGVRRHVSEPVEEATSVLPPRRDPATEPTLVVSPPARERGFSLSRLSRRSGREVAGQR